MARDKDWREAPMELPWLDDLGRLAGGLALLGIGILIGAGVFNGDPGYTTNLYTEFLSIAATVVILNRLAERRDDRRRVEDDKARLIRDAGSSSNETAKAAISELARRDWLRDEDSLLAGADLRWANMADANLRHANLARARLYRAHLTNARMYDVNLSEADMEEVDLHNADLVEANLSNVAGRKANLSRANLHLANVAEADLRDADISEARLRGANFSEATISNADLSYADLRGANLSGADLRGADLTGALLDLATLTDDERTFSDARLLPTSLDGATMPDGEVYHPLMDLSRYTG